MKNNYMIIETIFGEMKIEEYKYSDFDKETQNYIDRLWEVDIDNYDGDVLKIMSDIVIVAKDKSDYDHYILN